MIKCWYCNKFNTTRITNLRQHIQIVHPKEWKHFLWSYGAGPGTLAGNDDL